MSIRRSKLIYGSKTRRRKFSDLIDNSHIYPDCPSDCPTDRPPMRTPCVGALPAVLIQSGSTDVTRMSDAAAKDTRTVKKIPT